jgi:hypothetical protein
MNNEKEEMTIGIKLHIAPMSYNFLETWVEKKIVVDDSNAIEKISNTRTEVINACIDESVETLRKCNMQFDQEYLIQRIMSEVSDDNKQEIKIDMLKDDDKKNKSNMMPPPQVVVPSIITPKVLDLSSTFLSVLNSDKIANSNADDTDYAKDVACGILENDSNNK